MDIKMKLLSQAYEPYYKEGYYCLGIDCVLTLLFCIFWVVKLSAYPLLFVFLLGYYLLEVIFVYNIVIISIFEKHKKQYQSNRFIIVNIKEETDFAGRWESPLPKLYPKEFRLKRYRLTCIEETGRKVRLRCAISGKKYQLLYDRIATTTDPVQIVYGEYSRVIIQYFGFSEVIDILNHMQ